MSTKRVFTNATGAPVADNTNIMTAGPRGPALLQDIWLLEKLAQFDREVIPEPACTPRAGVSTAP
jgi:catalase